MPPVSPGGGAATVQLSRRAAAAAPANPHSSRSSSTPLTRPYRGNLSESDHVDAGQAIQSRRSRWNVNVLPGRIGSKALAPGRKRAKADDAEARPFVRSERIDGAPSGWLDGPEWSRSIGDGTVRSGGVTAVAESGRAKLEARSVEVEIRVDEASSSSMWPGRVDAEGPSVPRGPDADR